MKIQISDKRIIPDALVVWHSPGPEVDLTMDLKRLTFAAGSIERMYAFHILERFLPSEVPGALANWRSLLAPKAKLFLVNDDLEFIARSLIGGDLNIAQFNDMFSHPTYFTRDNAIEMLKGAGFVYETITLWFADVTGEFAKQPYELIVQAETV